jgi:exonuclease SbcC
MIPKRLRLSGFLSYRDPVELDFSQFDLACISGSNGAGKSSLLDAMTWALFGVARKSDDSLINSGATAAEVVYEFSYEDNTYRIQRTKTRNKATVLEFSIQIPPPPPYPPHFEQQKWGGEGVLMETSHR